MELNEQVVSHLAQMLNLSAYAKANNLESSKEEVLKLVLSPEADEDQVKSFTEFTSEQIHVYNAEELEQLKENIHNQAKKEGIDEGVGNTYGAMDKRIREWAGIDKNEDEKTMAYLERAAQHKLAKLGQKPNEELERLKRTLEEKNRTIDTHLTTIEEIKTQSERQMKQFQIDRILSDAAAKIPIEADEKMLPAKREFLMFQLTKNFDVDLRDGQVVLTDKLTGKEVVDKKTASPKNIDEFFKEFAPTYVEIKSNEPKPQGVQKGGAGLHATPIKPEQFEGLDLRQFKSGQDLQDYMIKSGHSVNDQKVQKVLEKWYDTVGKPTTPVGVSDDMY